MRTIGRITTSSALVCLLCFVVLAPGVAMAQFITDRDALMDLYNATNGPNWTNNSGWGTANPIRDWYGITQSPAGDGEYALIIDLRANNLTGQIPASWSTAILDGAFRDLEVLVLDGNPVSGNVLPEYGSLSNLIALSFNDTNLTGSLPSDLGELQNLEFLSFFNNSLTGTIPQEIFQIPTLQTFQVTFNLLEGPLPSGIGFNETLVNLRLGFNNITGPIPPDIADGASLEVLDLSENEFTGDIPAQIGGSTTLRELIIDTATNLTPGPIPPELATLSNLEVLTIPRTNRTGPIPSEFGNLPFLRVFDVEDNDLDGAVPASFAGLENLELFSANNNMLVDLPDMSGIAALLNLHVANNYFEFDDLVPNDGVETYQYAPQRPFGAPQSVGTGVGGNLTLDAFAAQEAGNEYQWLMGSTPITGATNITYTIENADAGDSGSYALQVTNADLPGLALISHDIDVTIEGGSQTTDRDALMALYNSTGGDNWTNNTNWGTAEPISEWFGVTEAVDQPGSVGTLRLIENGLQGPLPSTWESMIRNDGAFVHMSVLDLSDNILTGSLPVYLDGLVSIRELSLSGNLLQGTLPTEFTSLQNLRILNVADNGLSGNITDDFASMPSLQELNIRTNFFANLADLTSSSSLTRLTANDNFFQFDDIEPNLPIAEFSYSPQNSFGAIQSPTLQEGGSLTLSYSVGGSNNQYQWFLNSSPIEGATTDSYDITNASSTDEGFYVLQVTNPNVPNLVLTSNGIFVDVTSGAVQGEFVVTNTNDSGDGSLRAAIMAANSNPNELGILDEIIFNISGTGPHVIRPQSALPIITESVAIDGTTQPGTTCGSSIAERDLRIVLDGSQAGGVEGGLVFRDNQNTALVEGLVINGFNGAGILVDGTPLTSIQCSFIGTDATGTSARPNVDGIHARGSNNVLIGTGSLQTGNLISGNSGYGVRIDGQGVTGSSVVYGNLIGTDRTGTLAVPNSIGVIVQNGSALIGAPGETESNVISGNSVRAVEVRGESSAGTFLTNNLIGTDITGAQPLPNGEGILVHAGASGVIIGIFTDTNDEGFANLIAYNNGPGVTITGASSTSNRISANRMFENEGLGIDLGDDGLNTNDIGDGDEGPNRLMNSPQIVSSSIDGSGNLVVSYLVESDGTEALRIEFFGADADGEEGAFFLGADTYFLNEAGQTVQFNLGNAAALGVTDPNAIVATATDSFGNTSEFSGAGSGPGGGNQFVVTEPPDVNAVIGGNVPIQATVPAGYNATVREVCYRRTGEAEFTCGQLQSDGSGFQGAIPSSFVTERGVQYYFRFSDGTSVTTVPETDPETSAFVLPVQVNTLTAGGSFSPDTYRMISIPVELADGSFGAVLDEFGEARPNRWRLLRWEPTLEAYREYPELTGGFDPCEAYWLITFDGADFEVENGQSVNPTEPCFVTVRPGWNQFASPYAFPVAWSDVDVSGAVDGPVLYDASAGNDDPYVYDVQLLEPWQGYWLFNPGTQNVFMSFNPVEAVGKAGKSGRERYLAGDEYELGLRAAAPTHGLVDNRNHLGLSTRASDGFDELDLAEAPPIGDHLRLSILERDMRLAGSFRPAGGSGQAWDLRISGSVDGAPAEGIVRVSLEEFGLRPDGFGLRIVDLDEGLPVRLDEDGFEIELTRSQPVRNLRLILGTPAFSEEAGESIPEVPQRAELAQNYPNPFNPSTRIRYQVHVEGPVEVSVFDPLGRRVRTLVSADHEPGWYDAVWNGRDESGAAMSSGIYFYVLKTIDGSVSRTMVLLR